MLQKEHDKRFHSDIYVLAHPEQLRHFAFHFAKYAGRLVEDSGEQHDFSKTLADIAIIALSTCNVLNVDLDRELTGLHAENTKNLPPRQWLLNGLVFHGGKIAKACESLDHMEHVDYRTMMRQAVAAIMACVITITDQWDLDLNRLIVDRWQEIERKAIL